MVDARVWWSVVAGGAFGVSGAVLWLGYIPVFGLTNPFTLLMPVAAGLTGGVIWLFVVELTGGDAFRRGLLTGVLTGFLAHPVLWSLLAILQGEPFYKPSSMWFLSLLFGSIFTVPLALFTGVLLGAYRKDHPAN